KAWNELNGVVNAAKKAIDQAAQTKDAAIDKSNLTAKEKADLKKQVSDAANEAKIGRAASTKDADVESAKNTGVEKINNINVPQDRKSTRLNSSHVSISYAVFCL